MMEPKNQTDRQSASEDAWQQRLLPFMQLTILLLGLFFFAATLYQLYDLNEGIASAPKLDVGQALAHANENASLMEKQWASLVILETHILQQRYHQANVLLLARIWVRYLGFVTGMVLTVIGAVFILGKLREPETRMELQLDGTDNQPVGMGGKLASQSPGIILITMGTVLMLVTIVVHHQIEVKDAPVYTVIDVKGIMDTPKDAPPQPLQLPGKNEQQAEAPEDTITQMDQSDELMKQLKAREKKREGS